MENSEEKVAQGLLKIGAVKLRPQEPFTWASGWHSPIYCDNRKTLSYPEIRTVVRDAFAAVVKAKYPQAEVIAGVATGAIAENGTAVPENVVIEMRRLNCETDAQFQQYCRRANQSIAAVKNAKTAQRATSNAEGNYSVKVKNGTYYVLAVSRQVKGNNPVDVGGMTHLQKVTVQPSEELVVTSKFEIYQ